MRGTELNHGFVAAIGTHGPARVVEVAVYFDVVAIVRFGAYVCNVNRRSLGATAERPQ